MFLTAIAAPLILSHPDVMLLGSLAWIVVVGAAAFFTAIALMKRRLIK